MQNEEKSTDFASMGNIIVKGKWKEGREGYVVLFFPYFALLVFKLELLGKNYNELVKFMTTTF